MSGRVPPLPMWWAIRGHSSRIQPLGKAEHSVRTTLWTWLIVAIRKLKYVVNNHFYKVFFLFSSHLFFFIDSFFDFVCGRCLYAIGRGVQKLNNSNGTTLSSKRGQISSQSPNNMGVSRNKIILCDVIKPTIENTFKTFQKLKIHTFQREKCENLYECSF